jgi:hypothetical protein
MAKLPIVETVKAAVRFQLAHWRRLWGVALLLWPAGVFRLFGQVDDEGALFWQFLAVPLFGLGSGLGYAALMRVAFADENPGDRTFRPGPGGLQLGRVEWRLLGVTLLKWGVIFASVVAVLALVSIVGVMISRGAGLDGAAALSILLFLPGFVYLSARLSLAGPATVAQRRPLLWSTWGMTRGNVLNLLGASALMALIMVVEVAVLLMLGFPLASGVERALGFSSFPGLAYALIVGAVIALITAAVELPLVVGLLAHTYRVLAAENEQPNAELDARPEPSPI